MEIIDHIAARLGGESLGEGNPVSVVGGRLKNDAGGVIRNLEDGISVLVSHLDVIEDLDDLVAGNNPGRHFACASA